MQPSKALTTLKIIHWSITASPIAFAVISFYLISAEGMPALYDSANPITFIPIGLTLILVPMSSFLFKKTLATNLNGKTELAQKLSSFQTAHLMKIAILEAAALLALVVCFVTRTTLNYFTFGIPLLLLLLSAPSAFKITELLHLSQEETSELEG